MEHQQKKMKFFLVLAVAISAAAAVSSEAKSDKWELFKSTHKKNYTHPREEAFRKAIFEKKLKHIEEHNERFKKGLESYKMGVNKFTDMTDEEMKPYTHGLIVPAETPKPLLEIRSRESLGLDHNVKIPDSVDWRDQKVVTPVKDQLRCGSCWAFSSTGALESQVKITKGPDYDILISEQQLVDCVTDNFGCGGGWMTTAFEYIKQAGGIDSEEAYPYTGKAGDCHYQPTQSVAQVKGYAELKEADEGLLAEMVATKGPVSVAIDSTGDFTYYSSGVYFNPDCNPTLFSHAVLVVGYGTEDGQDYWLVKNSWGAVWGDNGYIKMARNRNNHCGIASKASYPIV